MVARWRGELLEKAWLASAGRGDLWADGALGVQQAENSLRGEEGATEKGRQEKGAELSACAQRDVWGWAAFRGRNRAELLLGARGVQRPAANFPIL